MLVIVAAIVLLRVRLRQRRDRSLRPYNVHRENTEGSAVPNISSHKQELIIHHDQLQKLAIADSSLEGTTVVDGRSVANTESTPRSIYRGRTERVEGVSDAQLAAAVRHAAQQAGLSDVGLLALLRHLPQPHSDTPTLGNSPPPVYEDGRSRVAA